MFAKTKIFSVLIKPLKMAKFCTWAIHLLHLSKAKKTSYWNHFLKNFNSYNDVYHVPKVRKNLVSGSLLKRNGFKLVFKSDNFVLTNGIFVGKGYIYERMFKLNIINKINAYFVYMIDYLSL